MGKVGALHTKAQTQTNTLTQRETVSQHAKDSHGAFQSSEVPLTATIAEFNKMHLKNSPGIQFQGGESPKDLLALHASLEKEKPWLGSHEKHKEIKRLQNKIELTLKNSPDLHLQAIKNSRSKILEHFKNSKPRETAFDIITPSNEAFSNHQDIAALKAAKDTLHFWDFAAVKAIKNRLNDLEPQKAKPANSDTSASSTSRKKKQDEYDRALQYSPDQEMQGKEQNSSGLSLKKIWEKISRDPNSENYL